MNYFYIKQIISDKDMFLHLLREFKKGTLEKQYKNSSINVNSRDNTVNFIRHPILI
jgi:hypothetical protein